MTITGGDPVELSEVDGGHVYYGAYNAGFYSRTEWTGAAKEGHTLVGTFTVAASTGELTDAQKAAVAGKSFTVSTGFGVLGNVELVGADAITASTPSVTIAFDGNGNVISEPTASSGLTYAVRTNNKYGQEVAAETTSWCQVAQELVSDGTLPVAKGQGFHDGGVGSARKYYAAKTAISAEDNDGLSLTDTTYFEEIQLHTADKITISASELSIA